MSTSESTNAAALVAALTIADAPTTTTVTDAPTTTATDAPTATTAAAATTTTATTAPPSVATTSSAAAGAAATTPPNSPKTDTPFDETEGVRYGKCKWFNCTKGWGFVTPSDGGQDIFVHQRVIKMTGFRSLAPGEEVEFECEETVRGLEAIRVSGLNGADCRGNSYRTRRRIRCYNCGDYGNHYAKRCPFGPMERSCHLCKKEGHIIAECPQRKELRFMKFADGTTTGQKEATPEGAEGAEQAETDCDEEQTESANTSASWTVLSAPSPTAM